MRMCPYLYNVEAQGRAACGASLWSAVLGLPSVATFGTGSRFSACKQGKKTNWKEANGNDDLPSIKAAFCGQFAALRTR